MARYVVELIGAGRDDLFVLDEPAGTAVLVDQDGEESPTVLLQRFRWPEIED